MGSFGSILNQIAFLFGFIFFGYFLSAKKILPEDSNTVLAKLENNIFIPSLVMSTFIKNFTVEQLVGARNLILISFIIAFFAIPLAILISRAVVKDSYIQKIYTYGLSFSNFGFMGNAVVQSLFPDIFFEYLLFTLPLYILIYMWGVPCLLLSESGKKQTIAQKLKSFVNPMFVSMIIGMIIGLCGFPVPSWAMSLIETAGDCMSPIAMILTGVVVSSISLKRTFTNVKIYIVSVVRLLIFPAIFMVAAIWIKMPPTIYTCALCSLAMPLGLNTIVIPSSLGKDTTVAAGMAIISHLLSAITIPLVFAISTYIN